MNQLALWLANRAEHSEAESLYRRALAINENFYGPEHPYVAAHLNNLATLLQEAKRFSEAEPLYRRALAIDVKYNGSLHSSVATDLNNLAQLLQATDRLTEAESLMRWTLTIDEQIYEPLHPNIATDLNNLAQLLQATNRLTEAEPLMRRALIIDEQIYGPLHPSIAIKLNNLAQLLKETSRLTDGEPLSRRHLQIFAKWGRSTGHEHPHFRTASENYTSLLREMGMSEEEVQSRALSALEVRTKADLPQDWAQTESNLGLALLDLGTRRGGEEGRKLLTEAVAAFRSALQVYTKADLPQDWDQTQNNLGVALRELGSQLEGEEGLQTLRESVDLLREVVSYQPADDASRYRLALALGALAFKLILDRQFAEAQTRCEEAHRLANAIGDGIQKTDRDNLIFIQRNLAHALLFQGHFDEALAIYRQNWDKPLNGKTFGEITLEDFATFDEAGLTHPDLSRMKQALGDLGSEAPSP
jgi:tetratricopeptide (TPR) repeat protein